MSELHLIINNYEVQEASTFFSMADFISALAILVAVVSLIFTIKSNKKSLEKTLMYETNRRKLLELNEVAISVKETEYELLKFEKMLIGIEFDRSGQLYRFTTRALLEQINHASEKTINMEIQFDLKDYNGIIKNIKRSLNENLKESLAKKTDELYKFCVERDAMAEGKKRDKDFKDIDIKNMCNDIAKNELEQYIDILDKVKAELLTAIEKINNDNFN